MAHPISPAACERNIPCAPAAGEVLEKKKILLQTIGEVAVRILHVFVLVLTAAVVFPLDAVLFPAIAVGAAVLTGFFFLTIYDSVPVKKNSPILPAPDSLDVLIFASHDPKLPGIYGSGKNSSLNALIQFLDSDPDLALALRKNPYENSQIETFEEWIAPLNPPLRMVEEFRKFIQEKHPLRAKIADAFRKFAKNYRATAEEIPQLKKFGEAYHRQIGSLRLFRHFFAAYDRAASQHSSVVDSNSQTLRYALSQVNPEIPPSDQAVLDPLDLLNILLGFVPSSHQLELIKNKKSGKCIEKTAVLSLEIAESAPQLAKMFAERCQGKSSFLFGNRLEPLSFSKAPKALRFHINRFVNHSYWNRFLGVEHEKKKRSTPIQVPSDLKLSLQEGGVQEYRLASLILHEGDSLKEGRFLAGRVIKGQKYLFDNQTVTPVDSQTWEQKILPKAYLLNYLPIP